MADNWVSSALYYGDGANERKVHYETDTKNIVDFEQAVNNLINTSFGDTTFRGTTTFENIHVTGTSQMDGLVTCDSGILTKGDININDRGSISSDVRKVTVSSKDGSYIDLTAGDGVSIHSDGDIDAILSIDRNGILSYNKNAVFEGNVTIQGTVSSPIKLPYTTITSDSTSTTIATTSGSSVVLSNSATGDVQLKTKSNHTFALTTEGKLTVDGNEVASKEVILNAVYPVGCTYITLGNTNPSSFLGIGTWERIGDGLQLGIVGAANDKNSVSHTISAGANTDGEWKHTMTTNELVKHTHSITCSKDVWYTNWSKKTGKKTGVGHTHAKGTYRIVGSMNATWEDHIPIKTSGCFTYSKDYGNNEADGWGALTGVTWKIDTNVNPSCWTGESAAGGIHTDDVTAGETGKSTAMPIINPTFGIYLWKRTA